MSETIRTDHMANISHSLELDIRFSLGVLSLEGSGNKGLGVFVRHKAPWVNGELLIPELSYATSQSGTPINSLKTYTGSHAYLQWLSTPVSAGKHRDPSSDSTRNRTPRWHRDPDRQPEPPVRPKPPLQGVRPAPQPGCVRRGSPHYS